MTVVTAPLPRALRDLHARHTKALAPIWDPKTGLTVTIKVPASITLAPERTRCKTCRKAFDNLIVLQMFCSYRCAGLPAPDTNLTTAPRMCKRAARSHERGEWAFKEKFATADLAQRFLKPGMTIYRCANCFFLHLGNISAPPQQHGVPSAPTTGAGPFADSVLAVLHARGQNPESKAAVAAAKRDVRAVFEALTKHNVRLPKTA